MVGRSLEEGWLAEYRAHLLSRRAESPSIDQQLVAEIQDLLLSYPVFYDGRDLDALLGLFAEGATYTTYLGTWQGKEQIRAGYESLLKRFIRTVHLVANLTIQPTSPTEAWAASYVHAVVQLVEGNSYAFVGSYQDRLERQGGVWYIAARVVRDGVAYQVTPIPPEDRLS